MNSTSYEYRNMSARRNYAHGNADYLLENLSVSGEEWLCLLISLNQLRTKAILTRRLPSDVLLHTMHVAGSV